MRERETELHECGVKFKSDRELGGGGRREIVIGEVQLRRERVREGKES